MEKEELKSLLLNVVSDTSLSVDVSSMAALALGLSFVGTADGDISSTILQTLMERESEQLNSKHARFFGLGLALLFLQRQEDADVVIETLKVIEHHISKQTLVLLQACAYAGTGNVLKVQEMIHLCTDHPDEEKEDTTFQTFAVIGIALIAMGEDIGTEMAQRTFNHLVFVF